MNVPWLTFAETNLRKIAHRSHVAAPRPLGTPLRIAVLSEDPSGPAPSSWRTGTRAWGRRHVSRRRAATRLVEPPGFRRRHPGDPGASLQKGTRARARQAAARRG